MDTVSITAVRAKAFNDVEKKSTSRTNPKLVLVMPTNEYTTGWVKTERAQWMQKEMNEEENGKKETKSVESWNLCSFNYL